MVALATEAVLVAILAVIIRAAGDALRLSAAPADWRRVKRVRHKRLCPCLTAPKAQESQRLQRWPSHCALVPPV